MTVLELVEALKGQPADAEVVVLKDGMGVELRFAVRVPRAGDGPGDPGYVVLTTRPTPKGL